MDDDFRWQPYKHGWLIYLMLSCLFASIKTDVGCLKKQKQKNRSKPGDLYATFFWSWHTKPFWGKTFFFSNILKYTSLLWHTEKKTVIMLNISLFFLHLTFKLSCFTPTGLWTYLGLLQKIIYIKKEEFQCENQYRFHHKGKHCRHCSIVFCGGGGVTSENPINCLILSALCGPVEDWIVSARWEILSFTTASPAVVNQSWSMGSD